VYKLDKNTTERKIKYEEAQEYSEELAHKLLIRDSENNYQNKTAFVFCHKCNRILITPKKAYEMIEDRKQKWIAEGYWNRKSLHSTMMFVNCPCGEANFISFLVFQYQTKQGTSRYKTMTLQFFTESAMLEYWHKLELKIP
jgi:hypothetical protein